MRFNNILRRLTRIGNLAGGEAYPVSPKLELASLLLTSFADRQFYRGAEAQFDRLRELLDHNKAMPHFGAQAAVFARNEFGMRSITHVAAAEIARRVKGEEWTKRFLERVVRRPDDVTEILAYWIGTYGKPIPNSMKKGLGAALTKFDAYQLAKYKAARAEFSLVDAVNLCHPPSTEPLDMLMRGMLEAPVTWEVLLSEAGKSGGDRAKASAWGELITSRKIGYFALLRNLRNIIEQAPEALPAALEMVTDERLIRKSLVLPFRYLTALKALREAGLPGANEALGAVSRAADLSLANVPNIGRKTLVIVDVSGSMVWGNSPVMPTAALFAATLVKRSGAELMLFDETARYVPVNLAEPVLTIAERIVNLASAGGTNFHAPLEAAVHPYERMVFLSDMQGWIGKQAPTGTLRAYEKKTGAHPHIYSFDLAGYGSLQFPQQRTYCLAGFSEKVFDLIPMLERGRDALINIIGEVEL